MSERDRIKLRLEALADAAGRAGQIDHGRTCQVLHRCEQEINRLARIWVPVPDGSDRFEIVQSHGPTLEFTGRLLADTSFKTERNDPLQVTFEIYETQGGALVAVSATEPVERDGFEVVRATVVEPKMAYTGRPGPQPEVVDQQAMRFAVMEHFEFHPRARSMTKKLGWSMRQEIA